MGQSRTARSWIALVIALLMAATSCSSSDEADSGSGGSATTDTGPVSTFTGHTPSEITRPPAEGDGIVVPQPSPALPEGYVQEEFFVGGTATSFAAVDTPDDGFWKAEPSQEAEYRTRVIVRRPAAEDFSGTVLVEWFNVSAIEAAPDWTYLSEEIGREGHAYIGVSTQAQGVEGGETLLDVEVDPEAAAEAGASTDTSGLKNVDPVRYGTLVHPGDAYAFDIFSQVGRTASESTGELLGGLEPTRVIGMGESQSAGFLTTLVNAVHPLDPVFDGFLIHSRGAGGAALAGQIVRSSEGDDPSEAVRQGVLIRTDLDVPVFLFETETDLTLLGYAHARQPNTGLVRTWEVAGTAHADAHLLRAVLGGPRDPIVGSLLGCSDVNTGPHHEVLQAAVHALVAWAAGGEPPPEADVIELEDGDEVVISRDEHTIALGGVRNPLTDAPVAAVTGDPPGGGGIEDLTGGEGGGICLLFGSTTPFDQATLVELYGTADAYVEAFTTAANEAVAAGFLLQPDADALIAEAEANRALFG